jgi:uncharacterized membrane protein (DUF2068 family)
VNSKFDRIVGDRPTGLLLIVAYKAVVATIFSLAAISLLVSASKYPDLQMLADRFKLAGKYQLFTWILTKILNFSPQRLEFASVGSALYATVTAIEAIGLWYQQAWAHWLVIGLVAIGILPELYEIAHGIDPLKIIVLMINVLMLAYLLRHGTRPHARSRS